MFDITQSLYGVTITSTKLPGWNDDVRTYALSSGTETIAMFYVDLYPREDKRGGAWMNPLISSVDGKRPQLGLFCANVSPPVGGQPALLTHREVETLFHEFGHLLHHCFSKVSVRTLAGTNVAWDFVELPSQIMENWCWEREALDRFARHHETGAAIPDELFKKMVRARTFRAANAQMRQLSFATTDLALHRDYDAKKDGDVMKYALKIMRAFSPAPLPDNYGMLAGFSHLFGSPTGYAAGYYSYKWAEVLDADAFSRFKKEGIVNPKVGAAFRDNILSQGNSRDPAELYRAFMGRDPQLDALLERAGLA
jgi:oligopeptidase A